MRDYDAAGQAPARIAVNTGNFNNAYAAAPVKAEASYRYQYNGHAVIGPSLAIAHVTKDGALILSNTQNAYVQRDNIQAAIGLPLNKIRVQYWEGAGSFGNSPARHDTGIAAAVMSQLAGAPVRLQLMRWDEHGWDNYGPTQMADMRGAVDANGKLVALEYTAFAMPGISQTNDNPTRQHIGLALSTPGAGALDTTNSGTQYAIPNRRIVGKTIPMTSYFKTSTMRAPNAPQTCFASEQFVDELAYAAKLDPYQFRLQNIASNAFEGPRGLPFTWDRWKNVIVEAARISKWQPHVAASNLSSANVVTGRGLALGGYAGTMTAIVADIEVNKKTGKILVNHVYGAQDTGLSVYLGGVENQAVGSIVQGASRALFEQVRFDKQRVTSFDFVTYPIMRFKDTPKVTFSLIQRKDIPSIDTGTVATDGVLATGSGEPPTAPMAAAIANAFFDATGARIREAPMTPARVRNVLRAGGSGVFGAA
jgi:CO/xanthine dehydrogenase Mo-binding subunit